MVQNFFIIFFLAWNCIRSLGEEGIARDVFEEYIARLQEKAKEKERKREEEKVMRVLYLSS